MLDKIIECIPNFSEGRRPEVVETIKRAIAHVPGVYVLDLHSDPDHNRSVITYAGSLEAVGEAAFAAIAKASKLIDLEHHEGEHPRIGASDVVPFIPLIGASMDECIELARVVGKRVGDELGIPVYLYERAASRPDRVNLEDIRRGEYEALKETIGDDPNRAPDFGPAKIGPAGAIVIGARSPLIAFNVFLATEEVSIARKIAKVVRHSSGGLRYVKAKGMLVDGQAQVSMNLTDYTRTPIARVVELIRAEASRYGVGVNRSELVGLIPQAALTDAARWYLQLDPFHSERVLETRLFAAMAEADIDESTFLDKLAAGTPTPGGGSATAYTGAMAAALVGMVARVTLGKKKYAQVEDRVETIAAEADALQVSLQQAVSMDAQAFDRLMEAHRLAKKTKAEKNIRAEAIERATFGAAAVPLEVARKAVYIHSLAADISEIGNVNAASDAGSASALALATLQGAALNVRANALNLSDREIAERWLEELEALKAQAKVAQARVDNALKERAGLDI